MTIDNNENLIITIDGRTKLISKQQIIKAFAEPKANCANYEREQEIEVKLPTVGKLYNQQLTSDKVVNEVIEDFIISSKKGVEKYHTTLESNNKDNFLNHLYEEMRDSCNYLKKLMMQKEDITDIVKNEPNDLELGKKIRKIYGN